MLPDMANHIITLMRKAKREGEVMQKMRKKSGIMLLWAMVLTLMLSLAYAPGVEAATKKSNVKSVTVTNLPAKKLTLKKGKSKTLKVKVTSTNKKKASQKVTYKSSKPKIVTVSSKGKVTAKKKGTATITITSKSNTKKNVKITVKVGTPVTSVSLNKTKATVQTGKSITLKATVKPKKPTTKDVIWSTSNSSIAKVSSKGKVKTLKAGKVKITATAADGSGKKKTATITVKDPVVVKKVDVVNGSTVQVTLSQATDLTAAAFTVKSNRHGGSTYNRTCKIDNVTSTDKTTYLVVLDSRDELNDHDHIQVTVTGLWGSKTSTATAVYNEGAFTYTHEYVWRGTYQESIDDDDCTIYNPEYGYAAFTVTDLPAGIKTEQVGDSIRFYGKPQAKGKFVSQVVVADESGNTHTYAITWLISSADTLCTAPESDQYYILNAKGIARINVDMYANGGSGKYKYSLVGTNYGLSINESDGTITGELKAASDYTVKVQVQDTVNTNLTATADVVIHVKQSIVVSGILKDLGGASLSNNGSINVRFVNKDKSDRFVTSTDAEIDENGAFSVALVNGTYDIKATCKTGSGQTQKYLYSQKLDTTRSGFDITLAVRKVNIVSDNSNVKIGNMTSESGWEDADGEVYGRGESLFLKEGTYNLTNKGRLGHLDVTATVTVNTSQALATAHVTTADTSSVITVEKPVQVTLKSDRAYTFFAFTPSNSGTYYFYSNSSYDTYGILEDASGNFLTYDDEEWGDGNFYFSYDCTAGTTYYVGIRNYNSGSGTATLNITATDPKMSDEGGTSAEALNNIAEEANIDEADAAPADAAEAEKDTTAEPDKAEVTNETAKPDKAEVTDGTAEPDKAEVTDEAAESDKAKAADETAESDKSESTDETTEESVEPTGNDVAADNE